MIIAAGSVTLAWGGWQRNSALPSSLSIRKPATTIRNRLQYVGLENEPVEPIEEAAIRIREGVKLPMGYICCGRQDFLYEEVCDFVKKLKELGEEFEWHDVDGFEHE